MNNPLSIPFVLLGFILIIGGIFWILRLFLSEDDDDRRSDDDERLISRGCGEYDTEGLVLFDALVAIILGIVSIVTGILI